MTFWKDARGRTYHVVDGAIDENALWNEGWIPIPTVEETHVIAVVVGDFIDSTVARMRADIAAWQPAPMPEGWTA